MIVCPSCGLAVAASDAAAHGLKFSEGDIPATVAAGGTVQCPGGQPVDLREHLVKETADRYGLIQAAAEQIGARIDEALRRLQDPD